MPATVIWVTDKGKFAPTMVTFAPPRMEAKEGEKEEMVATGHWVVTLEHWEVGTQVFEVAHQEHPAGRVAQITQSTALQLITLTVIGWKIWVPR